MADEYPEMRVLATGSSTLDATRKFRDTLAGRKHSIHLLPVLWRECVEEFGIKTLIGVCSMAVCRNHCCPKTQTPLSTVNG